MRLDGKAFALTCGVFWGVTILFATAWLLLFGFQGHLMQQLDHFYFGYSVSWGGAVIGGIWGFFDGCICGFVFAWLYNRFAGV
jgi:hypothetical protein